MENLYCGDCLEIMPSIQDGSIDMILCDLPYGKTKNKWDSIISIDLLWKEWLRICKKNAVIVLFGQDKFTAKLMLSQEKIHRYNLIWKKGDRTSGFLNAKKMPLRNHEDIIIFYRKTPVYNPQFSDGIPLHSMGTRFLDASTQKNNNYGKFIKGAEQEKRKGSTKKYPKSVLNFERPHPPIHPTQKPVDLLEYLIKTYTNEWDRVLDNCMGSGSTGVACKIQKRHFVGIEKEKKYFDMAQKRIEQTIPQIRLAI